MEPVTGSIAGGSEDDVPAARRDRGRAARSPAAPEAAAHPWDGYLTGPENELAMAAAQAMARGEHRGLSPLVVYGPAGVGKSRLLAGLVAERLRREPGSAVAHLDAETFAATYAEAAGEPGTGDGWSALRDRLRTVDLLILEDLEGLLRAPGRATSCAYARRARGLWRRRGGLGADGARDLAASRMAGPAGQPVAGGLDRADRPARAGLPPPLCPQPRRRARPDAPGRGRRAARRGRRRIPHPRWLARPDGARGPARVQTGRRQGPCTRCADGRRDPGRGDGPGQSRRVDRLDRPVRRRAVRRPARDAPRPQPAGIDRRGEAPGDVPRSRHTGSSFAAIGAYFGDRDPATVRHACRAVVERLATDPALAAVASAIAGPS